MADEPTREDLAAEHALGLLEGAERAEALRLCLSDPDFAAQVEAWSLRLSPLLNGIPDVEVPDRIWPAVAARIGAVRDSGSVVRKLRLWRGAALISGAVAASLAFIILTRSAEQAPAAIAISQLAGSGSAAPMAIAYDPDKGVLRLTPTSLGSGPKGPELWVIPGDGVPRSLGMIAAGGGELIIGEELRGFLKGGVTLAITLEDRSSAPHRAPTSEPILTGKISII